MPSEKLWVQQEWWAFQDLLAPLDILANRDPMGTPDPEAFLASWEQWVRLATLGPRVSASLALELKLGQGDWVKGSSVHSKCQLFIGHFPIINLSDTEPPKFYLDPPLSTCSLWSFPTFSNSIPP